MDWVVYVSRPMGDGADRRVLHGARARAPAARSTARAYSGRLRDPHLPGRGRSARARRAAREGDRAGRGHPRRALGAAAFHDARPGRRLGGHRRSRSTPTRRSRATAASVVRIAGTGRRVPLGAWRASCPNPSWSATPRRSSASASMPSMRLKSARAIVIGARAAGVGRGGPAGLARRRVRGVVDGATTVARATSAGSRSCTRPTSGRTAPRRWPRSSAS